MRPQLIVLLGPNGVGKSTIGRLLEEFASFRFLAIEEFFLSKYPTRDDFRANRPEAYAAFEKEVRQALTNGEQVVFEELGANKEAYEMINKLAADYASVFIRVDAPVELTLERVRNRGTSRNYKKDDAFVLQSRACFEDVVIPKYKFTDTILNADLSREQLLEKFRPYLKKL